MMDAGPAGGEGRRRGKKNRNRQGRRKRSKGRNRMMVPLQDRFPAETTHPDDRSVLAGRPVKTNERRGPSPADGPPDAFTLFCAYHLGITSADGYQRPQIEEVARRFGTTPQGIRELLGQHGLDDESIRKSRFDLEGAQMDIRLAPEGISRTETARDLWADYLEARQAAG